MKVVMSADELAKEDEKKRMKRAECRSERHHFSHRVPNCAEHYPFCPFCPFCPYVESITYVLSTRAMRATLSLWSVILPM